MTNKEAIEKLKEILFMTGYKEALELAIRALEERQQGKWIRKVDEVGFISHICSNCGVENEVEDPRDDKFCFNCGAEMEGDTSNA